MKCGLSSTVALWSLTLSLLASAGGEVMAQENGALSTKASMQIDTLLQAQFSPDAPGAAVLARHRGKTLFERCYGLADVEAKRPSTPESNFDLASVSKHMTAVAIMLLSDRGLLRFDDDIRKYLPEVPIFNPKRPIRVVDLLHHISGLPEYTACWETDPQALCDITNERVLSDLKDSRLRFPTGTKFEYCNTNYALLPLIVERISKRTFQQFMQDEIFRPLKMNQTVTLQGRGLDIPHRTSGYRNVDGNWIVTRLDTPACGDGNVFSNLQDLSQWLAELERPTLVQQGSWQRALQSGKLEDGTNVNYGFGWFLREHAGKPVYWHTGVWNGTRTFIGRWPEDNLSIIILCNREDRDPQSLAQKIAETLLQEKQ